MSPISTARTPSSRTVRAALTRGASPSASRGILRRASTASGPASCNWAMARPQASRRASRRRSINSETRGHRKAVARPIFMAVGAASTEELPSRLAIKSSCVRLSYPREPSHFVSFSPVPLIFVAKFSSHS